MIVFLWIFAIVVNFFHRQASGSTSMDTFLSRCSSIVWQYYIRFDEILFWFAKRIKNIWIKGFFSSFVFVFDSLQSRFRCRIFSRCWNQIRIRVTFVQGFGIQFTICMHVDVSQFLTSVFGFYFYQTINVHLWRKSSTVIVYAFGEKKTKKYKV